MKIGKGLPSCLKRLKEGEPFPDDFWNYAVNPITGFPSETMTRSNYEREQVKYHVTPSKDIFNDYH